MRRGGCCVYRLALRSSSLMLVLPYILVACDAALLPFIRLVNQAETAQTTFVPLDFFPCLFIVLGDIRLHYTSGARQSVEQYNQGEADIV
jgi:hypothetical protein